MSRRGLKLDNLLYYAVKFHTCMFKKLPTLSNQIHHLNFGYGWLANQQAQRRSGTGSTYCDCRNEYKLI